MKLHPTPPGRRRARGFTLIELVAAFLVFAIAIGVLMQILSSSLRSARQSSDYTMAALWAQSRLDTVGVGEHIEPGRSSGRFDDSYSWELDIQQVDPAAVEPPPLAAPTGTNAVTGPGGQRLAASQAGLGGGIELDAPFDLYQVDLTVFWGPSGRQRRAQFSTLRVSNPEPNELDGGAAAPQRPPLLGGRSQ